MSCILSASILISVLVGPVLGTESCTVESCSQCLHPDDLHPNHNDAALLQVEARDGLSYMTSLRIAQTSEYWDSQSLYTQVVGILAKETLAIRTEYVVTSDMSGEEYALQLGMLNCEGWDSVECDRLILSQDDADRAVKSGMKRFPDPLPDFLWTAEISSQYFDAESFEGTAITKPAMDNSQVASGGPAGFTFTNSLYVYREVAEKAWNDNGTSLGYWRSYTQSGLVPDYLDAPAKLIAGGVVAEREGCTSSVAAIQKEFDFMTKHGYQCVDSWWLTPACFALEDWRTECIAVIDDDWYFPKPELWETMATSGMRLAKITVGYDPYFNLINDQTYNVMFHWWRPDTQFTALNPLIVHVPDQPSQITLKSVYSPVSYANVQLAALLNRIQIDDTQMDILMQDASHTHYYYYYYEFTGNSSGRFQKIACNWLRSNTAVWSKWLIDPKTCGNGQFFNPSLSTCDDCPAGTYALRNQSSGLTACLPCPRGTANENPGLAAKAGSSPCAMCSAGSFSETEGSTTCTMCPVGKYVDTPGKSECVACSSPSGKMTAWTTMQRVETSSGDKSEMQWSIYPGANNKDSCGCESGYQNDTSGECIECRDGLDCMGMNDIRIQPGFMAKSRKSSSDGSLEHFSVYECVPADLCPGGPPETCSGGRIGLACNQCPKGMQIETSFFFLTEASGDCVECGSGPWWRPWWLTMVAALCLLLAWTPSTFPLEKPGTFTDVTVSSRRFLGALVICKQAISGMMQTTFIISNFDIALPNSIRSIYASSGIGMDLNMMSLECTGLDEAVQRTVLMNLLPLVILLYGALLCFLGLFLPDRQKWPRWPEVLSSIGALFAYFFITICNSALNMGFATMTHPNGQTALRYFPHIVAGDYRYLLIQMISTAGLLVWSVGGTALVVFCLYSQPKYASNLKFRKAMAALSMPYKNDKTWWYIVTLMRSLFVSLSVLFFEDGSAQTAFMTCVFLVYAMMANAFRPHFAPLAYYVDSAFSVSIVAILVYLQLFQLTGQGSEFLEALTLFAYFFICTTSIYIFGLRLQDKRVRERRRNNEGTKVFRPIELDQHMNNAFGRVLGYILPANLVDMGDLIKSTGAQETVKTSPLSLRTNATTDIVSASMSGGGSKCEADDDLEANVREVTIATSTSPRNDGDADAPRASWV